MLEEREIMSGMVVLPKEGGRGLIVEEVKQVGDVMMARCVTVDMDGRASSCLLPLDSLVVPALMCGPETQQDWQPSEALISFAAWLTTRPGTLRLGASESAAPAAEVVEQFRIANSLNEVRDEYPTWNNPDD